MRSSSREASPNAACRSPPLPISLSCKTVGPLGRAVQNGEDADRPLNFQPRQFIIRHSAFALINPPGAKLLDEIRGRGFDMREILRRRAVGVGLRDAVRERGGVLFFVFEMILFRQPGLDLIADAVRE